MAGPGGLELSCRYRRRSTLSWLDRSQQVHRQVTPLDMTLAVRQSVPLYRPVHRQAGRCLGIFAALLVAAAAVACSSAIPTPEPPAAEPTVASSPTRAPAPGATQAVTPPAATPTAVPTPAPKPTPATTLPTPRLTTPWYSFSPSSWTARRQWHEHCCSRRSSRRQSPPVEFAVLYLAHFQPR